MIRFILTIVLFVLCVVSYYPAFLNSGNRGSLIVALIAILLFIMSFFKNRPIDRFLKIYLLFSIFITLFSVLFALILGVQCLGAIMEILIPFVMLYIGASSSLSEKQNIIVLACYVLFAIIISYITIKVNIGGFVIESQYLVTIKNSLGGMLALAGVITAFGIKISKDLIGKAICIILLFILTLFILTIRARLALLAMLFVSILVYKQDIKIKYFIPGAILFIVVVVVKYFYTGTFITNSIDTFIYDSFFLNKTEDLTSGRTTLILDALQLLFKSPLWGNLTLQSDIGWTHNYLMLKLSSYGILGAIPWVGLYLYISFYILKSYLQIRNLRFVHLGLFLSMVIFIISLGEPTYPYGPGTISAIAYYFLGVFSNCKFCSVKMN